MEGDIIGFGLVCEWDDYDRKRFYISLCRISKEEIEQRKQQGYGETVKNRDILSTGYLKLEEHDYAANVALNLRESKIDIEMIMDELVSLRGYITTRMDAIDTQKQEIHYELHRLSSRLNNMDIDEDSFEPES
ncbi:hypothetical protein Lal_00043817 [Lupinus albus]|nr:hypothetical protein Lal_00043817 [Lupinus albus]